MKNGITLLFLFLVAMTSCYKEADIATNFQNNIKKFSFIKMKINGDNIDENLSLYGEGVFHSYLTESGSSSLRRYHYIRSADWERPCGDCNNNLDILYFLWNTVTNQETLSDRIGQRASIAGNFRESEMYMDLDYKRILYKLDNTRTDSFTYINVKDTIMDGKDYELTHLLFDKLSFEDDSGSKIVVDDLELRQVLRRR